MNENRRDERQLSLWLAALYSTSYSSWKIIQNIGAGVYYVIVGVVALTPTAVALIILPAFILDHTMSHIERNLWSLGVVGLAVCVQMFLFKWYATYKQLKYSTHISIGDRVIKISNTKHEGE